MSGGAEELVPRLRPIYAASLAAGFVATAACAIFANGYYVFVIGTMAVTAIVGIGLNLLIGLTGQISFGHVGFYAIGAYTVAILTTAAKIPFWLAWPAAALLAGVMGALLALPALRVRGPYLAMVTIAFGFIVENAAVEWRGMTGGQNGIMGIPSPAAFGVRFDERGVALLAIVVAASLVYAYRIVAASAWGFAMRAVRDSEVAAESVGLDPLAVKVFAFTASAACAGIAGGLFAPLSGFVTPSTFAFSQSLLFVLVVMIGGAGSLVGPLLGAVVVVVLPELLASLAEYRLLLFGILLLGVLLMAPDGIAGAAARLLRRRAAEEVEETSGALLAGGTPHEPLSVADLSIAFGGIRAVTSLDFCAKPGEVTALIGPNGAGKTTVLNMLGGFYRPGAGAIRLGNAELAGCPAYTIAKAGIARTYQTSLLFAGMTVFENLAIARCRGRLGMPLASGNGVTGPEAVEEARQLAGFVGYRGSLGRSAADLAHVDRRLVEIARALSTRPAAILLDEPAAGLSAADKARLARLLRNIADAGIVVVLVEHDMSLVMGISDKVVVLDAGVRIAEGTPRQVQDDPAVRKAYLGEGAGRHDVRSGARTPATGRDLLEVGKLNAAYGAGPVLKNVGLRVREHEMVSVLGANGAGKSTLMRALAGLHRPIEGGISLAGVDLSNFPAHEVAARGLTLVPEGRQVFTELTVLDNIWLGAFRRHDIAATEIEAMLERFPRLRARLDQRAGLLSGGEQQMLALARGLMARPRLLLLDEPSLGLAPAVIDELFAALERLRAEETTILLVDQLAGLALALSDRAYVLEGGEIAASGSAAEIASNDSLTRAYLGTQDVTSEHSPQLRQ